MSITENQAEVVGSPNGSDVVGADVRKGNRRNDSIKGKSETGAEGNKRQGHLSSGSKGGKGGGGGGGSGGGGGGARGKAKGGGEKVASDEPICVVCAEPIDNISRLSALAPCGEYHRSIAHHQSLVAVASHAVVTARSFLLFQNSPPTSFPSWFLTSGHRDCCSTCALRLRVIHRDKRCPLCNVETAVMVLAAGRDFEWASIEFRGGDAGGWSGWVDELLLFL